MSSAPFSPDDKIIHVDFGSGDTRPAPEPLALGQVLNHQSPGLPLRTAVVVAPLASTIQHVVFADGLQGSVTLSEIGTLASSGWNLLLDEHKQPVVLSLAVLADFLKTADAALVTAQKAETARLISEFPYLELAASSPSRGRHAVGSANLRRMLQRAFPSFPFSVVSNSYSGGSSIHVRWVDGPSTVEVEQVAYRFALGSFDGSDDSYKFAHSMFTELFGGARFVTTNRTLTAARYLAVASELGFSDLSFDSVYGLKGPDLAAVETVKSTTTARSFFVRPFSGSSAQ